MSVEEVKLLVSIVDRGRGSVVASALQACGLPFEYLCPGLGTANSKILDYLGLSETHKEVVLAFVPQAKVREAMGCVDDVVGFSRAGRGIMFSLPLSGVSGQIHQSLVLNEASFIEESAVEHKDGFNLVLAIVERGNVDVVMDAARACGARGGTVLHGRRAAQEDGENLLGVSLEPERDIIAMVVPSALKLDLMKSVNKAAGPSTPARGILFALPVEEIMGLPVAPIEDGAAEESPCSEGSLEAE